MASPSRGPASGLRFLRYYRLYRKFRPFTMVARDAFVANLYLADRALADPALAAGCVIECGTWRGGMAAALVALCGPRRDYFFFDSFAGLPPATAADGETARRWQADAGGSRYFDNCAATKAEFTAVVARAGAPAARLHVSEGFFADSFPPVTVPPIAILRLDADWYESTMLCLDKFWDSLLPGALVLVDDYYAWEGCRKAVHAFLARRSANEAIHQSRFGKVGYLRKS